jgi:hypothetical protein
MYGLRWMQLWIGLTLTELLSSSSVCVCTLVCLDCVGDGLLSLTSPEFMLVFFFTLVWR